MIIADLER